MAPTAPTTQLRCNDLLITMTPVRGFNITISLLVKLKYGKMEKGNL